MKMFFLIPALTLLSIANLLAQELGTSTTFEYSDQGLNDFVVIRIDSVSKEQLYSKTLNWIKETYLNPDLVLKMKIENEKVRIGAVASGLLKVRSLTSDLNYVVDISFKDNKYKFEILSLLYNNTTDYKQIPNFKTDSKMIKNFGTTPADIERYFNNLNESLRVYITGKSKKDDW
jgi:hypothetical protein